MKNFIETLIIFIGLVCFIGGVSIYFSLLTQAQETKLTATVPENEINHCVKILQDAGYIK